MSLIKIVNISKSYQDIPVIKNLSLDIPDGAFCIITGKSGCGKTTLLNIIGKLDKADSGKVYIDDLDIDEIGQKKYFQNDVAFLFQNFTLVENKTIKQNLEMINKKAQTDVSMEDALKKVGLENQKNTKIYKLSGGEQQRVALARVIMKKSKLVLADEPTGSLDSENATIVIDILRKMTHEGKTVIMVTHDKSLITKTDLTIELPHISEKNIRELHSCHKE